MSAPFFITGPAIISVSGGRTSGYMLHRILEAHGGALPQDVHAVFANTGREMPATLDFLGWAHWKNVVGLRADEMHRVERTKQPRKERWTVATPLADAGVISADVTQFWRSQPFDLGLAGRWEGNCDGCFLKSRAATMRMMADYPERMRWWADMEAMPRGSAGRGRTFRKDREPYAELAALVRSMPRLPFDEGLVEGIGGCAGGCGI